MLRLSSSFSDTILRDTAIELCLTVPAKLEAQLPYLPLLMQPLVLALQSKQDKSELILVGYVVTVLGNGSRLCAHSHYMCVCACVCVRQDQNTGVLD
jgi:hypothetical protein